MTKCMYCGAESPDESKFCGTCGKRLIPLGVPECPVCGHPSSDDSTLVTPLVRMKVYLEIECGDSRFLTRGAPNLEANAVLLPPRGELMDPAKYATFALCNVYWPGSLPFEEPREQFVRPLNWYACISTLGIRGSHMAAFGLDGFWTDEETLDVLRCDIQGKDDYEWESLGPEGLPDLDWTLNFETLRLLVDFAARCAEMCENGPDFGDSPEFEAFLCALAQDGRLKPADMPYVVEQIIKGYCF